MKRFVNIAGYTRVKSLLLVFLESSKTFLPLKVVVWGVAADCAAEAAKHTEVFSRGKVEVEQHRSASDRLLVGLQELWLTLW